MVRKALKPRGAPCSAVEVMTCRPLCFVLLSLAACSRGPKVTVAVAESGSHKPVCHDVHFEGQLLKDGALTSPFAREAIVVTSDYQFRAVELPDCAFQITLPRLEPHHWLSAKVTTDTLEGAFQLEPADLEKVSSPNYDYRSEPILLYPIRKR
jgi:hypothetical protein